MFRHVVMVKFSDDMTEGLFQGQSFELSLNLGIGTSRPERHKPAVLKN